MRGGDRLSLKRTRRMWCRHRTVVIVYAAPRSRDCRSYWSGAGCAGASSPVTLAATICRDRMAVTAVHLSALLCEKLSRSLWADPVGGSWLFGGVPGGGARRWHKLFPYSIRKPGRHLDGNLPRCGGFIVVGAGALLGQWGRYRGSWEAGPSAGISPYGTTQADNREPMGVACIQKSRVLNLDMALQHGTTSHT